MKHILHLTRVSLSFTHKVYIYSNLLLKVFPARMFKSWTHPCLYFARKRYLVFSDPIVHCATAFTHKLSADIQYENLHMLPVIRVNLSFRHTLAFTLLAQRYLAFSDPIVCFAAAITHHLLAMNNSFVILDGSHVFFHKVRIKVKP